MAQNPQNLDAFDAVVVGSGAGGGTAVQVLIAKGMRVALLEAGPMLDVKTEFKEHKWPYDYDHRGAEEGGACLLRKRQVLRLLFHDQWWVAAGRRAVYRRGRQPVSMVPVANPGWRTNHYGRMSFRFAEYDFKPYDKDGLGFNWPISYQDIAPYYDKAEEFIGVCGTQENVASCPDGKFHTAPPPKVHEMLVKKSCDKLGIICIANRRAVITKAF